MGGLVALVDREHGTVEPALAERALDAMAHRATAGRTVLACGPCVLVAGIHPARARDRVAAWRDESLELAAIADGRLDAPERLAGELGLPPDAPDARIVAAAYARWGDDLARHLPGELAAIVWDGRRRRLVATRDALGVRPLFHATTARHLALASEVEPLLEVPGVGREPNARLVLEALRRRFRTPRETFIEGIARLLPGHVLVAERSATTERRWFERPTVALARGRPGERAAELRELLRASVAARLDAEGPVVLQLSGGIDSSGVVVLADDLRRAGALACGALHAVTARYPGLDADEEALARRVVERTGVAWHGFDATEGDGRPEDPVRRGDPLREAPPSAWHGFAAVAASVGARVMLTGVGGDELFFEEGAFRDLAARKRYGALLREAARRDLYSTRTPLRLVADALRTTAPRPLRRIVRALRRSAAPSWLGPALRDLAREKEPLEDGEGFTDLTQEGTWRELTSAGEAWNLEARERLAARSGVALRHPYLDERVVRFVLALPFEDRLPEGRMKRLLRDALAPLLPPEIVERRTPTVAGSALELQQRQNVAAVAALLADGEWASERFVPREAARRLVASLESGPLRARIDRWVLVWRIASIERWLRALA